MTPTLSVASAETATVEPEIAALFTGAEIETVGAVVSGTGLLTVTLTAAEVEEFPAASRATAVNVWELLVSFVESKEIE